MWLTANLRRPKIWRRFRRLAVDFVSVMPRTWKDDRKFREEIKLGKIEWSHLLSRTNNRTPQSKVDHYSVARGKFYALKNYTDSLAS